MTRTDIIHAAFKVWGRELYQSTSLAKLAAELGVSKPALYRHFKNKQTLLDAMYKTFFDDCASFIKPGYDRAVKAESVMESHFIMMRTLSDYYARNMEFFVFSLTRVFGSQKGENMEEYLRHRGIDLGKFWLKEGTVDSSYPPLFQLSLITLTFWMGIFHKSGHEKERRPGEFPTESDIQNLITSIEVKISKGLGFHKDMVEAMNYEELENQLPHHLLDSIEDEGLLRAVAAVVAEAGPWNASMDMVARRSGLSKSGLYAHFKNKQDMLRQLFHTEFERLVDYAEAGARCSDVSTERFYMIILSIADYLRSRSEILIAIDWLKTQRLDLGLSVPPRIYETFYNIKPLWAGQIEEDPALSEQTSQWILFLIVHTLMRRPRAFSELPNSSVRRIFRFIGLGVKGFKL
jgi:AcrR family transcriptional regulator